MFAINTAVLLASLSQYITDLLFNYTLFEHQYHFHNPVSALIRVAALY